MNFGNFISTNNIRAVALTLLWGLLSSCAQIDLPFSSSQDEGYLVINTPSIDVSISSESLTKSGEITLSSLGHTIPSVDDFKYKIEGTTVSNEPVSNEYYSRPTGTLVLKAGKYTLKVSYGNSPIGEPYFYKEQDFEILPGQTASLNLDEVKMANSLIKVDFPDDLSLHLPTNSSKLTYQYNSGSHSEVVTTEDWRFVPAGEVKLIISGTNSAGVPKELTFVRQAKPATAHTLSCSLDVPEISLTNLQAGAFEGSLYFEPATFNGKVSNADKAKLKYQINGGEYSDWTDCAFVYEVTDADGSNTYKYIKGLTNGEPYKLRACLGEIVSNVVSFTPISLADCVKASATAAHTKNTAGELNGTKLTSTYTVSGIPSLAAKLITLTASGSTKSGETVMSSHSIDLNASGDTESVEHTNKKDWPYIPQGTYANVSTVTCTFPEGGTATVSASITVQPPTFKVALLDGSYTSYDKYAGTNDIKKNITEANKCNAETLYNLGASWTISQELMTNTNYSKVLRFYDGTTVKKEVNTFSAAQHTGQSLTGLTWGAHTIKATVTFDGVEIASPTTRTHHITGLPYTAAPPKNSGTNPWIDSKGNNTWTDDCVQLYYSAAKYPRIISPTFNIPQDINVEVSTKIYREYYWAGAARGPIKVYQYNSTSKEEKSIYHARLSREETLETKWSITMSSTYNAYYIEYEYMADTGKTNVYYFNVLYR